MLEEDILEDDILQDDEMELQEQEVPQLSGFLAAIEVAAFSIQEIHQENYRKLSSKELFILLARPILPDLDGEWELPMGFVHSGEALEQAAARRMWEFAGLENMYLEQLNAYSRLGKPLPADIVSTTYLGLLPGGAQVQVEEGYEADWFQVRWRLLEENHDVYTNGYGIVRHFLVELESDNGDVLGAVVRQESNPVASIMIVEECRGLAPEAFTTILRALIHLRRETTYCNLALSLMPPLFTLTQLQQVYEVVLGKPLLKAAFRRKIAPLVLETDYFTENTGHRPSRLFQRNWEIDPKALEN